MEAEIERLLLLVPNPPHESVPDGKDEKDNVGRARRWGEKQALRLRAEAALGAGRGARHPRVAAGREALRLALHHLQGRRRRGWSGPSPPSSSTCTSRAATREVLPPYLVTAETMTGTGQLPKFEEDLFKTHERDAALPHPHRRGAGHQHAPGRDLRGGRRCPSRTARGRPASAPRPAPPGSDTRGLIRQHQFHKVELVKFAKAEESYGRAREDGGGRLRGAAPARAPPPRGAALRRRHGLLARRRPTTSRCGARARTPTARSARSRTARTSRPGASACATAARAGSPGSPTRSTARAWPSAGPWSPSSSSTSRPTGRVVVPEALRPYMGGLERIGRAELPAGRGALRRPGSAALERGVARAGRPRSRRGSTAGTYIGV